MPHFERRYPRCVESNDEHQVGLLLALLQIILAVDVHQIKVKIFSEARHLPDRQVYYHVDGYEEQNVIPDVGR